MTRVTSRVGGTVARSGNYVSGRDKRADELKTALGAIRRDVDGAVTPRILNFCAADMTPTETRYLAPWFSLDAAPTTERFLLLPSNCRARNLYVRFRTAGTSASADGVVVVTVRRNGTATDLSVKLPVTGVGASNRANKVTFEAGDRISISVADTGTIDTSPVDITAALEVV